MHFHHTGYLVKNIEDSMNAFKVLGYETEQEIKVDEIRNACIAFLQKDGYRVELVQPAGKDSPVYGLMRHYRNQPYHLCFSSDDLEEDISELRRAGYMIVKEAEPAPCMDNKNVVFLIHADIGMIELYESSSFSGES